MFKPTVFGIAILTSVGLFLFLVASNEARFSSLESQTKRIERGMLEDAMRDGKPLTSCQAFLVEGFPKRWPDHPLSLFDNDQAWAFTFQCTGNYT